MSSFTANEASKQNELPACAPVPKKRSSPCFSSPDSPPPTLTAGYTCEAEALEMNVERYVFRSRKQHPEGGKCTAKRQEILRERKYIARG